MRPIFAASIMSIGLAMLASGAQGQHEMSHTDDQLGLGEIMAMQQMRHIKLWFAGAARNWQLADYEVDELKEGFEDVNKQFGGDTVEKMVGGGISDLEKAIEGKDQRAFATAFDKLTAGCNNCHRTLNHGFIVIQRPTALPYTNQVFTPQR